MTIVSKMLQSMNRSDPREFASEFVQFKKNAVKLHRILKELNRDAIEKCLIAVFASSYPSLRDTLNVQLTIADQIDATSFAETLKRAAVASSKRKHTETSQDGPSITGYCTHCGNVNHLGKSRNDIKKKRKTNLD